MDKLELSVLLLAPIVMLSISLASIVGVSSFSSFETELNELSGEASDLKLSFNHIKNNIDPDKESLSKAETSKLISFNEKLLNAVKGLLGQYSGFSSNISDWVVRQNTSIIILSILNILFVLSVRKRLNDKVKATKL